jgi:hypothetical protein
MFTSRVHMYICMYFPRSPCLLLGYLKKELEEIILYPKISSVGCFLGQVLRG